MAAPGRATQPVVARAGGMAGSGPRSHLSVLSGGKRLFCRCWASELSVFTLSRSDSGVSVATAWVILGKELSWGGGPGVDSQKT